MADGDFVFQNSNVATVVVAAIQVVFTAVAALVMDRAGRKLLLILSGAYVSSVSVISELNFPPPLIIMHQLSPFVAIPLKM